MSDDPEMKVARALFDHEWGGQPGLRSEWDGSREYWLAGARAAIAAMPTRSNTKIVELLRELRDAQDALFSSSADARSNWRADARVESDNERLEKAWAKIDAALAHIEEEW